MVFKVIRWLGRFLGLDRLRPKQLNRSLPNTIGLAVLDVIALPLFWVSSRLFRREGGWIRCFKFCLISDNGGGQIHLMILEILFAASRHFGLSMAFSFLVKSLLPV